MDLSFKWIVNVSAPLAQPICVFFTHLFSQFLEIHSMNFKNKNVTTSNGGSLGLWIDEERSQLR